MHGLFAIVAAAAAIGSGGPVATAADGRRASALGDLPAVVMTDPVRRVDLGNNGPVDGLAWLGDGSLAVATGLDSVLHVLRPDGYRTARWELKGEALAVAAAGGRAVVLLAPVDRVGRARLAIVAHGRPPRDVALPGVRAGWHRTGGSPPPMRMPALVVAGDAALVVGDRGVMRIDPVTGRRSMHRVAGLRPVVERTAFPLRGGRRIAVAGRGLLYLDPRRWRVRRVARRADVIEPWDGGVLAAGPGYAAGYDAGGRRVFHRRLPADAFVTVAPDGHHLILGRCCRNGAPVTRTLNP